MRDVLRTTHLVRLLLSVCLLSLAACSSRPVATDLPAPDPVGEALGRTDYRIGPGDLMLVKVFQVDDLERQVRVDSAGMISLPLIGAIKAAGLSRGELEKLVTDRYHDGYLQDPQVSVLIQEFASQRITVGGAVAEPGNYPMIAAQRMTLQQAIAEAKGVSAVASRGNVVVFRKVDGQKMVARFDLAGIEKGAMPDPEIYAGDIVVVYRSDARLLLRTMLELTPFLMVWRAYR